MNAQEVFDKVVSHLRGQGRKSRDSEGCLYRSNPGNLAESLACAAGALIEDSEYDPRMERLCFKGILSKEWCPVSLKKRLESHYDLIWYLQMTHDDYEPERWEARFEIAARRFGLTYAAPR